ncbi:MAG: phage tail tape measure protein [Proteobacteria bacterium]|nr:phage tail tape measure protein [Pseudomonadota bacterium]
MADFEKVYSIKFNTKNAQNSINKLDRSLDKVGEQAKSAGKDLDRYIGAKGKISMDKLSKATGRASSKMKGLDSRIKATGARLSAIGSKLNRWVTLPLIGAGVAAIKFGMDLNKSMANVSTLLTGGEKQINSYKKSVQDMAIATGKSTDDLAGGLYDVVSALGESTENVNQLGVASRASVAGLSTTKEAIGLLTATAKGYGDVSAESLQKISDLSFMTVKLGVTTFPELAASMGKVVPLASAMNTSQSDLFGTMATLTGVTGTASEVTTQLASVYASFLKPTEAMTKLAKEQGFETATSMLKSKGLAETISILKDETKGEADEVAKFIRRKEGQIAVLALTGGQADTYTKKLKLMGDAAGATDDAFKKQTEGINKQGHSWDKTKQRMIVFGQRLGDRLLPAMGRLLDKLEPVIKYLENMSEETMDSWVALGKWAIGLSLATKGLGSFLSVVSSLGTLRNLTTGISSVGAGMSGLPGKIAPASRALQGFNLLAAGAAGYAVGSAISEIALEPHSKAKAKQREGLSMLSSRARRVSLTGSTAEKEKLLADISSEGRKMRQSGPSMRDIVGTAVAPFAGTESPNQAKNRIYGEAVSAKKQLRSSIKTDKFESWLDKGSGGYKQSGGGGGNTTTININAAHADAKEVSRIVRREQQKSDKRNSAKMRTTTQQQAAGQI